MVLAKGLTFYPFFTQNFIYTGNIASKSINSRSISTGMKRIITTMLMAVIGLGIASGQSQTSAFELLKLQTSSHISALGGGNVSLSDPDIALRAENPAVASMSGARTMGLEAMSWMAGTAVAGIDYTCPAGERSQYGVSVRYADYGVMDETDAAGNQNGTFTAKDILMGGCYSYRLTDMLSGGVSMHAIYSKYSYYSSAAIAVDLGLLYTSASKLFSAGLCVLNLGGQLKPFEDTREKLPSDICAGASLKLAHAPFRISMTLDDLGHWDASQFYSTDGELEFGDILKRHIIIGTDILLTDQLYASVGLNLRKRAEYSTDGSRGLAGFSAGIGLQLNRLSFGLSMAKYQISSSSLLFNFAISI